MPVTWCHCVGGGEAHLTLTGYREAVITGDWCVATGLRALYTGAEVAVAAQCLAPAPALINTK